MVDFAKFTDDQLWEIYKSVNVFEWNSLLGQKPDGFDKLPRFRLSWWHHIFYRRTKDDYTHPIWCLVQYLMPEDFFEKKKEENHKEQMDALREYLRKTALTEKNLRVRFGKKLFEHMSRQ